MEELIAQAKGQFDQILSYVLGNAQNQQLNEVEKGVFYALLKGCIAKQLEYVRLPISSFHSL